jgi:uncharacterized damage-inducible protein DinB
MTYGGKDIAAAFRTVRGNTLKIAEEIPEEKYSFRASPDTRTIADLLTHIALSPTFALDLHGNRTTDLRQVNFPAVMQRVAAEAAKPRTKADIIALLKSEGERFAAFVEGVSDDFLAEHVAMMPGDVVPSKSRFEMLLSPKEHEMHHRGQLMLLQRMAGIVPHLTREREARMAQARAAQAART